MRLPRLVLALSGLVFLCLGLAFLLFPEQLAGRVDLAAGSAVGVVELQAISGGLEFGLGTFLLVAAFRVRWVRAALGAQVAGFGGLALGRSIGMLTAGIGGVHLWFLAAELTGALFGLMAFHHAKRVLLAAARTGPLIGRDSSD
ncbi:MAG: DUF4345 family protein [Gemmatimonadales bacterium]